jgi:hypothetical protein
LTDFGAYPIFFGIIEDKYIFFVSFNFGELALLNKIGVVGTKLSLFN